MIKIRGQLPSRRQDGAEKAIAERDPQPTAGQRIAGDKFQLFEMKLTDIIGQERIDDMFDGRVDIEIQLSSYETKSFIIVYTLKDIMGNLRKRVHAVSAKFSQLHSSWEIRDTNEDAPWRIEGQKRTRQWLAQMTEMRIYTFACVQSSTDPDAAAYNNRVSFNTMRKALGQKPIKVDREGREHVTLTIKDVYPDYDRYFTKISPTSNLDLQEEKE